MVPTISVRVDWLTFRLCSGFDSLVICPNSNRTRASQPFAEIEELIYQIFLYPNNPRKQIINKRHSKLRVPPCESTEIVFLGAFSQKNTSLQEGDYCFFSTRGESRELHCTALNVENGISWISLRKTISLSR